MAGLTVAVCVITFRRAELLDGLLGALAPQLDRAGASMVVVDNDPGRSAEAVVRGRAAAGVPVRYESEPRPGIPVARNRALHAAAGADLVVFTDDDVRPAEGWLDALLAAHAETGADVVTGPVRFVFGGTTPRWAAGAHCFRDRTPIAVDPAAWPATNNVLLRRRLLDDHGIVFDETYGLAGGSDTQLFRRIGQVGGRFAWADEARVDELVPPERSTMAWAVRRSYRTGNTAALCDLEQVGRRASLRPTVRAAARWAWWGTRSAGAAVVRVDPAAAMRSVSSLARAGGLLAGLTGARYQEYGRARGRAPAGAAVPGDAARRVGAVHHRPGRAPHPARPVVPRAPARRGAPAPRRPGPALASGTGAVPGAPGGVEALGLAPGTARAVRRLAPALVHAHFGRDAVQVLPLVRRLGVPLVVTFHGHDATRTEADLRAGSASDRLFLARWDELVESAARFLAVSDVVRDLLLARGVPEAKVERHYIGVAADRIAACSSIRREPGSVVFTGRLVPQKGLDVLLRALAGLPARLVVIGDGPERPALEDLARRLGVAAEFRGFASQEEVWAAMGRARVAVVPSQAGVAGWQEAFGLVAAEAQAAGTPVIASTCGGLPEAVAPALRHLLFPEGDVDALAERLGALLADPGKAARLGADGQAWVAAERDLGVQSERLDAIYEEVAPC